jgi:beta-galactosidase
VPPDAPAADGATASASYSGAPDTLPAAMLDGDTASGGWSNAYVKAPTALLPPFSRAHASDWVSVAWPSARTLSTVKAFFTTDATHALPAAIEVSAFDGSTWVPVGHPHIEWANASNQPTIIAFDPISTSKIRLEMTSAFPGTSKGFLQIAELQPG